MVFCIVPFGQLLLSLDLIWRHFTEGGGNDPGSAAVTESKSQPVLLELLFTPILFLCNAVDVVALLLFVEGELGPLRVN